ncbi:MAG: phospholipase D-like domain-containing protein, partial [Gemmatimonadaceae bacterium]
GDRPLHDVAVHLTGDSGSYLARWFDDMWSRADPDKDEAAARAAGPRLASRTSRTSRTPRAHAANSVRLLRTTPRGYASAPRGLTEILDAYVEAIERARSFIYLESQYFSARPIARAVRQALDSHPELEVVLLLNQNPDITGYRTWQDARLAESELLGHARVGAFSLWSTADSFVREQTVELTQVFIHSKVAVIDDEWATIGTANLDGASLHSYGDDFISWLGQRIFRRFRNVDLNVELLDGVLGEPRTGVVRTFRADLWSRHLGGSAEAYAALPATGWLSHWRTAAQANVAALAAPRGRLAAGRVLPYVPTGRPRDQLRALGVDLEMASLDLRFDPGPLEVHCSPGWTKRLLPERLRAGRAQ